MNKFEYIAVFFSIILGLAVIHILIGVAHIIRHRGRINFYLGHAIWTLNIFLYLLSIWWTFFAWSILEVWTFGLFLFLMVYAVAIYLIAAVMYPEEMSEDFDFKKYFQDNRVWLFSLILVVALMDWADTYAKHVTGVREISWVYLSYAPVMTLLLLLCLVTRNLKVITYSGLIWMLMGLYYNALEIKQLGGSTMP